LFSDNKYHLKAMGDLVFYWQNGNRNKDQWVTYGQDVNGTFDTLIPQPPQPPTLIKNSADINGDGIVNVLDLSYMLGKWKTTDTTADLNSDGIVNVLDLSRLLSSWG
jgi:hypothetical protein